AVLAADRLTPAVEDVLNSGHAQPMDTETRALMEARFGHDFSQVRVHTDRPAAESVDEVGAIAYTVGRDIVFGSGRYSPNSNAGRRLLAHELAHVVQQDRGGPIPSESTIGSLERSADQAAEDASSTNSPVRVSIGSGPVLARQSEPGASRAPK